MSGNKPTAKWYQGKIARNILKTCGVLLFAFLISEGLYFLDVGAQNSIIVIVLGIFIIAAATDGYVYGISAALAGVFFYDYLVTFPRYGFSFTIGFPVTLCIMLLVTLVTSTVTAKLKTQGIVAHKKEQRAELLYDINRKLLSSRDIGSIAYHAMEYLVDDLNRSVAFFTDVEEKSTAFYFRQASGDVSSAFFANETEMEAARLTIRLKEPIGIGTRSRAGAGAYYHPIIAQGVVYGAFGISCSEGAISDSSMDFLGLLAEQTAQALRVQMLMQEQQKASILAETEKNRNSFLRGISHDLRTPLTSILGASATFLESAAELSPQIQSQLIEDIHSDSQWLLSMVENILSVTRIHSANMTVNKTEEAAEEVVAESVSLFRKRFPAAEITIIQPDELLLVPMDAILISQVITNLLDNSQRHADGMDSKVTIEMAEINGFAEFVISDTGPGIREDIAAQLFEIHPSRGLHHVDAARGLGIGLSICKTIIDVHGGRIYASNLPQGGAQFSFALPLLTGEEHLGVLPQEEPDEK